MEKSDMGHYLPKLIFPTFLCLCYISSAYGEGLAIGITEPKSQASLSFQVQGTIDKIFVTEGDQITAGEVLLELDRSIENLERQRKWIILKDQSELREVRGRIDVLAKQVSEGRILAETGGISVKQLEDEELALSAAKAQLESLIASKRLAEIDHNLAEQYFEQKQLTSPVTGVVTFVHGERGETIQPQETLVKVVDVSTIRFVGTFPISQDYRFMATEKAILRLMQHGEVIERRALITYVSPLVDAASGLRKLFAEVDNSDFKIIPGTPAELRSTNETPLNE